MVVGDAGGGGGGVRRSAEDEDLRGYSARIKLN